MKYDKYTYLYPPRPVQTTSPTELSKYDTNEFIAQPKYNGTCCVVFISEKELIVMNRHNRKITSDYSHIDFRGLYSGKGWMVLCGEFLNKNKLGENGKSFNLKFIMFDILVYDSEYLLGSTFLERQQLLEKLFPCSKIVVGKDNIEMLTHACITNCVGVYKAPNYFHSFDILYKDIVDTDVYEGLVLKRKDAKLTLGMNEKNNYGWQFKCRKPTKNYDF